MHYMTVASLEMSDEPNIIEKFRGHCYKQVHVTSFVMLISCYRPK